MRKIYTHEFLSFTLKLMLVVLISMFAAGKGICQSATDGYAYYRVTAYSAQNNRIISQSNIVKVAPGLQVYVPNTFTPNEDGMNDKFGATGQGIASFSMQIYNRWGELVFESHDLNDKWDGRFHGEIMPNSVYLYKISVKGLNGHTAYKSGSVTLLM
jgi:gliding motility-associated-like protein